MTCAQFDTISSILRSVPPGEAIAYVLASNPIYANMERTVDVAMFDTMALLDAYYEASKLAVPIFTLEGERRMYRIFRPDSLLWNYNANANCWDRDGGPVDRHAFPAFLDGFYDCPRNPTPPNGPVPHIPNSVPASAEASAVQP